MSARLFFMPALHLHFFAYGFSVGNFWLLQIYVYTEFCLYFRNDHVQMLFPHTRHKHLMRFRVVGKFNRRVFLSYTRKRLRHFILFALCFWVDGHRIRRGWVFHRIQYHLSCRGTESVPRAGVLQLGNGANIPGTNIRNLLLLFSAYN